MDKFTIQPGLLVSLHTRTEGGVEYHRYNEQSREVAGALITEWETEKLVHDPAEFKLATEARTKVRSLFAGVCVWTPFGFICPKADEAKLYAAAAEANAVAAAFNAAAKTCTVKFDWFPGEIAESNELAAKAIKHDLETLLRQMEKASTRGDVKELRAAAQRAKQLDRLLGNQQELKEKTGAAVKAARSIARKITKRVHKEGEDLALVLEKEATAPIRLARFALLGEVEDVAAEPAPAPVDLNVVFEMSAEERAGQRPEGVPEPEEPVDEDFPDAPHDEVGDAPWLDDLSDPSPDVESDPSPEELEAFHARRAAELGLSPLEGPGATGEEIASAADATPSFFPDFSTLSEVELFALMNEQHVKLAAALGKDPNLPEIAALRAQQAAARAEFMRRTADPGGAA